MKKNFRFLAMAVVAMAAAVFTGCSSDDDFLAPYEESAIQTRAISSTNALIDFDNVPSSVMASDQYGNNLSLFIISQWRLESNTFFKGISALKL